MSRKLDQIDLDALYLLAKTGFDECISNEGNAYICEEIKLPVNQVATKNDWVRIQFDGIDAENYLIEVRLLLFSPSNKEIGYYCYHENQNGEVVDDYLVFE